MITSFLAALAFTLAPTTTERFSVFPRLRSVQDSGTDWHFKSVRVDAASGLSGESAALREILNDKGIGTEASGGVIHFVIKPDLADVGAEGYTLTTSQGAATLTARTPDGIFNGVQSLRQLLKTDVEGARLPCGSVVDSPRFRWRGMMLDTSRHFFPKPDILRLIDSLSRFKINTFHWHLNDDGGWRIQIKKYPELTARGAWRVPKDGRFTEYTGLDFPPVNSEEGLYGGFYTQDDIREIVRYATSKHVTIVPEIEMPGHNLAATRSYPWLVCSPSMQALFEKYSTFVYPNIYCPAKESTYVFLENVLDEVMALFPSKVIHIGGDEVDKFLWNQCDDCKALMKKEGMKDASQLESYFIERIEKYLNAHGRQIIGWDEIVEGGLAPNAKVMSWRGVDGGREAAKLGHDVVMTPWESCYFDNDEKDIPISKVLAFDPSPPEDSATLGNHVIGAQTCIWTERIPTYQVLEDRLFPRLLAMAQVLWADRGESDESFMSRLDNYSNELYKLSPHLHLSPPRTTLDIVPRGTAIHFGAPNISGSTLVVSRDGGEWVPYEGPFTPLEGDTFKAALRLHDGTLTEASTVRVATVLPTQGGSTSPGLTYKLVTGSFAKVPDFASLTPVLSGITPQPGILGSYKENFAIQFLGYLKIDQDGVYRLSSESDDGSYLKLSGVEVVDNDGAHGPIRVSSRLHLKPGLYPLEIGYFQLGEDMRLKVSIEGPGLKSQVIPAKMFVH